MLRYAPHRCLYLRSLIAQDPRSIVPFLDVGQYVPVMSTTSPYIRTNIPAIGDLIDMVDCKNKW